MKRKYAVFHVPGSSKPWRLVCRTKFWWWSEAYTLDYDNEVKCHNQYEELVDDEIARRAKTGSQSLGWKP